MVPCYALMVGVALGDSMDAGVFTDPSITWWLMVPCYVLWVGVEVGDSMDAGVFTGVFALIETAL
jgi:hypothetical protein